jgi:hypothetical protein
MSEEIVVVRMSRADEVRRDVVAEIVNAALEWMEVPKGFLIRKNGNTQSFRQLGDEFAKQWNGEGA